MGPLLRVLPDCRQMSAGAVFHVRLSWGGTHFQVLQVLGRIHLLATVGLRFHSLPGKRSLPRGPHRLPTVWQPLQGQQGQTEVECHMTAYHRSDIPSHPIPFAYLLVPIHSQGLYVAFCCPQNINKSELEMS